MTISAAFNLILDPIFIFGWFGFFPAMELAGAATAMTLSRLGALIVSLWFISQGDLVLSESYFRGWVRSAKRILHVGIPAATSLIGPGHCCLYHLSDCRLRRSSRCRFWCCKSNRGRGRHVDVCLVRLYWPLRWTNWGRIKLDACVTASEPAICSVLAGA